MVRKMDAAVFLLKPALRDGESQNAYRYEIETGLRGKNRNPGPSCAKGAGRYGLVSRAAIYILVLDRWLYLVEERQMLSRA